MICFADLLLEFLFRVALLFICQGSWCCCVKQVYFTENTKYSRRVNFRRKFTLSGDGGIWTLAPLLTTCTLSRGVPSAILGTSPNKLTHVFNITEYKIRSERISSGEGGVPAIVDPETFCKVQKMLKVNKRAPAHKWTRVDYLLTDKLFCGSCGAPMVGESGTGKSGIKYSYYLCTNHKRGKTCHKKAIRQDWLES